MDTLLLLDVTGKKERREGSVQILRLHHGNSQGIVEMDREHFLNSSSHLLPSHHLSDPSFQVLLTPKSFF